jgi:hypothetical protein
VLKVLEQLPEGPAMSVLAAVPADLDHQLDILPACLHHLAIEAALPSIRRHHSLTLSFHCLRDEDEAEGECEGVVTVTPAHGHAVLHAARTSICALKVLDLRKIPVEDNDRLLQMIAAACMCPSDIRLDFDFSTDQCTFECNVLPQIVESLSSNSALTSLSLDVQRDAFELCDFDCLFVALNGLQRLELSRDKHVDDPYHYVTAPRCIVNMPLLTHLCLGLGFDVMNVPEIVRHTAQLQAFFLRGNWDPGLQELPSLSSLTALTTLELQVPKKS